MPLVRCFHLQSQSSSLLLFFSSLVSRSQRSTSLQVFPFSSSILCTFFYFIFSTILLFPFSVFLLNFCSVVSQFLSEMLVVIMIVNRIRPFPSSLTFQFILYLPLLIVLTNPTSLLNQSSDVGSFQQYLICYLTFSLIEFRGGVRTERQFEKQNNEFVICESESEINCSRI